jgi:hypothetical protein
LGLVHLLGIALCILYVVPTPSTLSTPSFVPLAGASCSHVTAALGNNASLMCTNQWKSFRMLDLTFLSQVTHSIVSFTLLFL